MNSENKHAETFHSVGDDRQVAAYFLGELPPEEQARLEEACFNDEQFAEFVFAVESELIDQYARGGLTATERQHFEQNYLINDQRLARVEFAVHLRRQFKPTPAPQPQSTNRRWWQKLFASDGSHHLQWAVTGLALLLFGGLTVRWLFIKPTSDPNIIVQVTPTPDVTPSALPLTSPSPSPTATNTTNPIFATITLLAGSSRAPGPMPVLKLPANTTIAELRLRADGSTYPHYRAELTTRAGILWQADNFKPQSNVGHTTIPVRIPADKLKNGDYNLLLYGRDEKGEAASSDYTFRVVRN